jgi:hypothetical protein
MTLTRLSSAATAAGDAALYLGAPTAPVGHACALHAPDRVATAKASLGGLCCMGCFCGLPWSLIQHSIAAVALSAIFPGPFQGSLAPGWICHIWPAEIIQSLHCAPSHCCHVHVVGV